MKTISKQEVERIASLKNIILSKQGVILNRQAELDLLQKGFSIEWSALCEKYGVNIQSEINPQTFEWIEPVKEAVVTDTEKKPSKS